MITVACPLEQTFDPRYQLTWTEWFRQVIIATELESQNLINFIIFGRNDDDGDIACRPDFPAQFISVHTREHDIEDPHIRGVLFPSFPSFLGGAQDSSRISFLFQIGTYNRLNIFIIFYDSNMVMHTNVPFSNDILSSIFT